MQPSVLHASVLSAVLVFATLAPNTGATAPGQGVQIQPTDDRVRVEIDGQLFTEYYFTNVPRPFLYPLVGPHGLNLTRDFPMKETPGEVRDHPHHRSFWVGHGAVNGHDCWAEGNKSGRILHERFTKLESGKDAGIIAARNTWVSVDGKPLCHDERTLRFHRPTKAGEWLIDLDITWLATQGPLTLGDTKEGTIALRLSETMRLTKSPDRTEILNSNNDRNAATWGKRAKWCDYSGPIQDKIVGVAIFDHPSNPRHPTWWHVRDYGLFAANPFGKHDFENLKENKTAGDLELPAGGSVTFRYRFFLHAGNAAQAKVAEKYDQYTAGALK